MMAQLRLSSVLFANTWPAWTHTLWTHIRLQTMMASLRILEWHSSAVWLYSFFFPWLVFQLFAVACVFCFPTLCTCWWSHPGMQVLLVPLSPCTAAGKSFQTAWLQHPSPPALLPSTATCFLFLIFFGRKSAYPKQCCAKLTLQWLYNCATGHKERNKTIRYAGKAISVRLTDCASNCENRGQRGQQLLVGQAEDTQAVPLPPPKKHCTQATRQFLFQQ